MILEIHNFTQNEIDEKLFQKVAEISLKTLGVKDKIEISLALVGNGRMRRLNKMYRKKNRVTDVLAFGDKSVLPYLAKAFPRLKKGEEINPAPFKDFVKKKQIYKVNLPIPERCGVKFVQPPDGVKRLGEIILCYPQAKKQAKRLGHPLEKELAILLIHGILHLVGYEHERGSREAEDMKEMEERVLKAIESKAG